MFVGEVALTFIFLVLKFLEIGKPARWKWRTCFMPIFIVWPLVAIGAYIASQAWKVG